MVQRPKFRAVTCRVLRPGFVEQIKQKEVFLFQVLAQQAALNASLSGDSQPLKSPVSPRSPPERSSRSPESATDKGMTLEIYGWSFQSSLTERNVQSRGLLSSAVVLMKVSAVLLLDRVHFAMTYMPHEMLFVESGADSSLTAEEAADPASPVSSPEQEVCPNSDSYAQKYETIQAIGKGAFGFVKTARRRSDQKQVTFPSRLL